MAEENKTTQVAVVDPQGHGSNQMSVEDLISKAITKKVPVETMEKLLAMRRELKAEFAKEQFNNAMADFQSECPVIKKDKDGGRTNAGQVAYKYAPLESIVTQVKGIIRAHGFSYAIKTQTGEGKVKATCIVKHTAGHAEESDFEVPLGTKTQVMSMPQVVAAALTFAKRYAFCNAFGIMTGDEDVDGQVEKMGQYRNASYSSPQAANLPEVQYDETPVAPKANVSNRSKIFYLMQKLKIDNDEFAPDEIKKLTQLDVNKEENHAEIIVRLENIHAQRRELEKEAANNK